MPLLRQIALAAALGLLAACQPVQDAAQSVLAPPGANTRGLDPALLQATLRRAEALPRLNSLIVARDGEVVAERVYDGPGLDQPVNIKSASKSVLAALVGVAVGRGDLRLEQPVASLLVGRIPDDADPRVNRITVEHLLTMRAGLQSTSGQNYGAWAASGDWVRYALGRPFEDEPGGRMIYSTGTSHILSTVLTEAADRSTLELARDWLGEPLDVEVPFWPRDPQGVYTGGNNMRLSPRAMLAFGELYRNDGVVGGRRVLPEGWVQASWTPHGVSRFSGSGYGYGWWIGQIGRHPVRYAWGYGGQMIFVLPSLRMTAVMTSDPDARSTDGHLQALRALVSDGLVPAAERGAGTTSQPSALARTPTALP